MSELNIYAKVQQVKVDLQTLDIKKSGSRKVSKNSDKTIPYFQLPDFLLIVNQLFLKYGLHSLTSFTDTLATLTITNIDNPEQKLIYTSPNGNAGLINGTAIQNIGAAQTYQRRYLIVNALDIAESDFDGNNPVSDDDTRDMLIETINGLIISNKDNNDTFKKCLEFYEKKTINGLSDNQLVKTFNKINEKKEGTNE
jgi:hypothetical protein